MKKNVVRKGLFCITLFLMLVIPPSTAVNIAETREKDIDIFEIGMLGDPIQLLTFIHGEYKSLKTVDTGEVDYLKITCEPGDIVLWGIEINDRSLNMFDFFYSKQVTYIETRDYPCFRGSYGNGHIVGIVFGDIYYNEANVLSSVVTVDGSDNGYCFTASLPLDVSDVDEFLGYINQELLTDISFTYVFDFGDGQIQTIQDVDDPSYSVSHIYKQKGTYFVTVNITITLFADINGDKKFDEGESSNISENVDTTVQVTTTKPNIHNLDGLKSLDYTIDHFECCSISGTYITKTSSNKYQIIAESDTKSIIVSGRAVVLNLGEIPQPRFCRVKTDSIKAETFIGICTDGCIKGTGLNHVIVGDFENIVKGKSVFLLSRFPLLQQLFSRLISARLLNL